MGHIFLFATNTHMFKILVSTALAAISAREQCEWVGSVAGTQQSCLSNYYIAGICGSGARGVCKHSLSPLGPKYDFQIQCCTDSRTNYNSGVCKPYASGSGDGSAGLTCGNGESVWGLCASGALPQCEAQGISPVPKPYAAQCCENREHECELRRMRMEIW